MSKSIQETVACPECGQPLALVNFKKYLGSKYGLTRDVFFDVLWYCVDCKEHGETIAHGGLVGLKPDELTRVQEQMDHETEGK